MLLVFGYILSFLVKKDWVEDLEKEDIDKNMQGEELRELIFKNFQKIFGEELVFTRRRAATGGRDDFDSYIMYNPELDIWVGPENTSRNILLDNHLINQALRVYGDFLHALNDISDKRCNFEYLNKNPRFFLAIEVAGSGSKKHLLGEMFNATILGKIGIVIAANKKMLDTYLRHVEYINFAYGVRKTDLHFNNLMVIDGRKLLELLRSYSHVI